MMTKYEITKEIFNHILAMTKHEDEKAGRIILSIAFLSAASASVFRAFVNNKIIFLVSGLELISITYFFSVLCVVLGSLYIMDAVGPNLNIPSLWKSNRAQENEDKEEVIPYKPTSIYFFEKIAEEDRNNWCNYFLKIDEDELIDRACEDHVYESHLVAEKIQNKVSSIKTAKIFFIFSIILFVIFTFLGVTSYSILHDC